MMPTWSSSLELDWQDVLAVIQPEDDCYDSEVLQKNLNYYKNARENLKDGQQGFECPCPHLRPQWSLLPLGSITEIHEHTSAFTADDVTSGMFPPDNFGFMTEGPLGDVHVGQNANSTLELRERWQSSRSLSHQDYVSWDADSQSHTWSCTPSFEGHFINQDFLSSPSSGFLLEDHRLLSPLSDFLQMTSFDCFGPEMAGGQDDYLDHDAARQEAAHFRHKLASRTEREDPNSAMTIMEDEREPKSHPQDCDSEADSDSGLSLDFSHSFSSKCTSESSTSSCSSSTSGTSSFSGTSTVRSSFFEDKAEGEELYTSHVEVGLTIKQEDSHVLQSRDHKICKNFSWMENIVHDHSYNKQRATPSSFMTMRTFPQHDFGKTYKRSSSRRKSQSRSRTREEKHQKINFSNALIVHLPVEEFNELLDNHRLSKEQLTLIKDIRRRGKNKIAAQNCRRRKLDTLLGLQEDVSRLRRHRLKLSRENQEAVKKLQETKHSLCILYQALFSSLKDEKGRPLDTSQQALGSKPIGIKASSWQQEAGLPKPNKRLSKKQTKKNI